MTANNFPTDNTTNATSFLANLSSVSDKLTSNAVGDNVANTINSVYTAFGFPANGGENVDQALAFIFAPDSLHSVFPFLTGVNLGAGLGSARILEMLDNGPAGQTVSDSFFINLMNLTQGQTGSPTTVTSNQINNVPGIADAFVADLTQNLGSLETNFYIPAVGADMNAVFQKTFSAFLQQEASVPERSSMTLSSFLTDWDNFTTVTAVLTDNQAANGGSAYTNMPTYQQAYDAKFNDSGFQTFVRNFIQNTVSTDGYFLPSQFYASFQAAVNAAASGSGGTGGTGGTGGGTNPTNKSSLDANGSAKVAIALELIAEMISFITTIQNSATSQSKLLTFYTDEQSAYTTTANNIPTFTTQSSGPYHSDDTLDIAGGNATDQAYAQNLRDFRSIINDNSQNIQSDINQSNQAVNQETNLITQILQEFATLLQTVFH